MERVRFTPMVAQKYIDRQKPRILFVHNALIWYTKPFFMGLSKICDIKFIFTHVDLCKDMYGVETSAEVEGFDEMKYNVIKRYFNIISPSGIPLGLIKDLFQERYDIVVATSGSVEMLFCFLVARLRNKSVILKTEEWGWKGKSQGNKLVLPLINYMISHADAIIVTGTKQREYMVSRGASPSRVFIMPNASNIIIREEDYKNKERLKEKLDIVNKKVILYVGRLVKQKGVEYLIRAFHKLRMERDDIALLIVGEGEYRGNLEVLSRNLNIEDSVYFAGFVENANLPPYYLLGDVCVMPSITYGQADAWGFVVNEAMRAEKPVIATDAVGAAFDLIKDGKNGFIVPERNHDALYKAMKTILSDSKLAKKMGEESKRILEQGFTYEHMIEGFIKAVNSVNKVKKDE